MPRIAQLARGAAAVLDLLLLLALVRVAGSLVLTGLPGLLREEDPDRGFRTLVLLALARVLVEGRAAPWARALRWLRDRVFGPTDAERVLRAGAVGGAAGAAAAVLGLLVRFPRADGPPATVQVPLALLAGLAAGLALGPLVRHAAPAARRIGLLVAEGAPGRLGALLAAGGAAALVLELHPMRDWACRAEAPPAVALGAAAGLFLLLLGAGLGGSGSPFRGRRAAAAVASILLAAATVVAAVPPPVRAGAVPPGWPRAVLLVTIDTLRADHLGCYGYGRDTSPALDRLAKECALFESAWAPMPTTDPSHTAMLTGLHPRSTGVMTNGLSATVPGLRTLGSWLVEHGYRTGAITSRAHLSPDSIGLPGFDTDSSPTDRAGSTDASLALRRATAWVDRYGDAPFFLWVHFWDPHGPYDPPREPERSMFVDEYRGGFSKKEAHRREDAEQKYSPEQIRYATGLYDGEIRYADDHVGRLVEAVRRRLGRENVLVVVVADHGEALDELARDYRWGFAHSLFLARATLHVPLLIGWPGRIPEGVRVPTPVSIAGIAPTLTHLLASEPLGDVESFHELLTRTDGRCPERREPVCAERCVFFEPPRGRRYLSVPELAAIEGDRLLVDNAIRGRFLVDLVADPRGERNLLEAEPEVASRLLEQILLFRRTHVPAPVDESSLTGEKAAAMEGLGYLR